MEPSNNLLSTQVETIPEVQTLSVEKPSGTPPGILSVPYKRGKPSSGETTIFSSLEPGATNSLSSLAYQAQGISESGDYIRASQPGVLYSVDVGLSSWACESGGWNTGDCVTTEGATFDHPITLNIYEVDHSGSEPSIGTLVASKTQTFSIPYRPSADADLCDGKKFYDERTDACLNGLNTEISFDFSENSVILPEEFIYGIEYNTQSWGDDPIGTPGPHNSLNFALVDKTSYTLPIGEDVEDGDFVLEWPGVGLPLALYDFGDLNVWPFTGAIQFNEKTTKDDCKKGGWKDLGFRNQGQCIRYANTGKDSR